ncbi:hypothetical protein V2A60_002017 [Cordyceps javanica]
MAHPNSHLNEHSYYQMDPQVTGDQLSSHPSHNLHDAAYPESDYQPGMARTPPLSGASPSQANAMGQDSKPYPPPEPGHAISSDSIHDAAYPDSNYRPGGGYSPIFEYRDSHHGPPAEYSRPSGKSAVPASNVIDNAAYPESNYRPGTSYSATESPGTSHRCPLPCPKHLETAAAAVQSPWTRDGPSSSALTPPGGILPQPTGSELPPPPYQLGRSGSGNGSGATAPPRPSQTEPASTSYVRGNDTCAGYQPSTSSSSPSTRLPRQQDAIPMTTFPVYQNAIGHVANRSNASSALERGYKEYDRDQAKLDDKNRRRNRRKWLIGTLATTVVVAAIIGVIVAVIKFKVFGDDDDD